MEISLEVPLDDDGFLDRACPACDRRFRWKQADETGEEVAASYFCPYCGQESANDEWFTPEQVGAIQRSVASFVMPEIERQFRHGGSAFKVEVDQQAPPPPLELDEAVPLATVASPCHPGEPVKVDRDLAGVLHCLICGSAYTGI
jgi:hypothetical protein